MLRVLIVRNAATAKNTFVAGAVSRISSECGWNNDNLGQFGRKEVANVK